MRALIFPGQGAQYPGMGKDFYENFSEAKAIFDEADDLLSMHLSRLMFEGPVEDLTQTKHSQLSIFVMSVALSKVTGLTGDVCAGLSLGEYSALVAAGKLSFTEGLDVVKWRGQFMQEACEKTPGTMAVVLGLSDEAVENVLKELGGEVWTANFNCPNQVVLAGTTDGIAAAEAPIKAKGAKRYLPLQVSGAFHSKLMQSAQDQLRPKIEGMNLMDGSSQIVMNVPGDFVTSEEEMIHYLIAQVTSPVRWASGVRAMDAKGVTEYVEIGPGKTLAGMNRKIGVQGTTQSIEKVGDLDAVA